MPQADPAACCPDAYYCPAAEETKCPRHRDATTCCAHPDRHIPMDRDAWNLAQEHAEQGWLISLYRRACRSGPVVLPWAE